MFQSQEAVYGFKSVLQSFMEVEHENLAKIIKIFDDDLNFYVISEDFDTIPLTDCVGQVKEYSENYVAEIIRQCSAAILALHSKDLFLGFITMTQIEIIKEGSQEDPLLKLCGLEMGFAYLYGGFMPIASQIFNAPEFLTGEITKEQDVWKVGVIMFILLTGNHQTNYD